MVTLSHQKRHSILTATQKKHQELDKVVASGFSKNESNKNNVFLNGMRFQN